MHSNPIIFGRGAMQQHRESPAHSPRSYYTQRIDSFLEYSKQPNNCAMRHQRNRVKRWLLHAVAVLFETKQVEFLLSSTFQAKSFHVHDEYSVRSIIQ